MGNGNDGTIQFNTDQIATLASQTMAHQKQWDDIWNGVMKHLSNTAAEALSQEPGGSLSERTQAYHRKTQQYTANVQRQGQAVGRVGDTAVQTNSQMTKVIRGA